ncbi:MULTISPECIES: LysR substrate-binding domain-containing protein [unclassified Pseudomonas]|uniref:LysR family transcriptional regulator n=1 Tax=unclassified Pseudomonas TaxID=196821 RepID=UPI00224AD521|nr:MULTISPECIES: LysR substrate-binding domain-containing protein [unclassified Pseudomonas]MCX2888594.1 LysR substrate-binding domain-containing protein [Pseudomonas sp. DCB_BI]MDH4552006.1 LysR family transcriptional regulator [Pseudomonas sp. BN607]
MLLGNEGADTSPMVFKLRHMEVFRAVMLTGSISAAAKLLYVSQPAVSKLIQYIEGRLTYPLFERINNRLVPTAEAQVLFREVERVYQAALEVNECALALGAGGQRKLRISCSASLSTVVIPIALAQLKRESPSLNIEWQTSLMGEMPNQILSKKVDLSIAALPVVHDHLHSQAFMRGRMVVVMPPDHPLAGQPALTLQQLEGHALLLFRPDMPFGKLLAGHIERRGLQLKSLLSFTNANEAVALVRQGMGISVIDEFVAQDSGLAVVPLADEIHFDISFVHSRFEPPSHAALHLMRVLQGQAQKLGRAISD